MTRIKLLTSQLLYDIQNIAYVEGHVLEDDTTARQHTRHLVTDIAEDGNIDIIARALHLAFASLPGGVAHPRHDDTLTLPKAFTLRLATRLSDADATLLTRLAHHYMVACALCHWLSITHPEAAPKWRIRADECHDAIRSITYSPSPTTRRPSPF